MSLMELFKHLTGMIIQDEGLVEATHVALEVHDSEPWPKGR